MQVTCRKCGGDHWTLKCPLGDDAAIGVMDEKAEGTRTDDVRTRCQHRKFLNLLQGKLATGTGYVPPHLRRAQSAEGPAAETEQYQASVRVTNLSDDADQDD